VPLSAWKVLGLQSVEIRRERFPSSEWADVAGMPADPSLQSDQHPLLPNNGAYTAPPTGNAAVVGPRRAFIVSPFTPRSYSCKQPASRDGNR